MSRSRKYNQATKRISTWQELSECTSETHCLKVDLESGNGWVTPKERTDDDYHDYYLSTHTFYGGQHKDSTRQLQKRGFNVEIVSWD
jgi:hypothetical protein